MVMAGCRWDSSCAPILGSTVYPFFMESFGWIVHVVGRIDGLPLFLRIGGLTLLPSGSRSIPFHVGYTVYLFPFGLTVYPFSLSLLLPPPSHPLPLFPFSPLLSSPSLFRLSLNHCSFMLHFISPPHPVTRRRHGKGRASGLLY